LQKTNVNIQLPAFGLGPGEATAFNMVNTNTVTGFIKGGITLVMAAQFE
jgi:hypothetical protein